MLLSQGLQLLGRVALGQLCGRRRQLSAWRLRWGIEQDGQRAAAAYFRVPAGSPRDVRHVCGFIE
eukprot:9089019-Pyramimonas_sp.AAC.1